MDIRIYAANLHGTITAIPSKSHAIRILISAALANKPTEICLPEPTISNDILAAIEALKALGASVNMTNDIIKVKPVSISKGEIPCGESATLARLLLPVVAALRDNAVITGEGSLATRPFTALCNAMEQNGCIFGRKSLPISFKSKIRPGNYMINGSESSQYISGLMFALPLLNGDSEIILTSALESVGYVDMTIAVLYEFGIEVACLPADIHRPNGGYFIRGRQSYISPGSINIEGDWSNAAFWLAAGVNVTGLNPESLQKDKLFSKIKVQKAIDASDVPDLVPILAVQAAFKHGETKIYNAGRLRIKESNRLETVYQMIKVLGGNIELFNDGMTIYGTGRLIGGVVDSYGDHRIAMAAAIAACGCESEVIITNAQAVDKSYPGFFDAYHILGGEFDVIRVR